MLSEGFLWCFYICNVKCGVTNAYKIIIYEQDDKRWWKK